MNTIRLMAVVGSVKSVKELATLLRDKGVSFEEAYKLIFGKSAR